MNKLFFTRYWNGLLHLLFSNQSTVRAKTFMSNSGKNNTLYQSMLIKAIENIYLGVLGNWF